MLLAGLLAGLAGIAVAQEPSAAPPPPAPYKEAEGPRAVESLAVTIPGGRGARDIPVRVFFPQSGGPYPVILFSHGLNFSKDHYSALSRFWSSHGYLVLHPQHQDRSFTPPAEGPPQNPVLDNPQNARQRLGDLAGLLDSLELLEGLSPRLRGKVDASKVAAAGHSYGSLAPQLLGGAKSSLLEAPALPLSAARLRGVVLLAPEGRGISGLHERSWENFGLPLLVVTGDQDRGPLNQPPEWRLDPFQNSPAGLRYAATLAGADHYSFLGPEGLESPTESDSPEDRGRRSRQEVLRRVQEQRGTAEPLTGNALIFAEIRSLTLAFLDAFLKEDPEARAFLDSAAPAEAFSGRLRWKRR